MLAAEHPTPVTPSDTKSLHSALKPLREHLRHHHGYDKLVDLPTLRRFMEHHVFAVWDFMSLLKGLQIRLTCVQVPWVPVGDPEVRRFINEIVLGEETDEALNGSHTSHFEMYLAAMHQCGADTGPITRFVELLVIQTPVPEALRLANAPIGAASFVLSTFSILERSTAEIAAAFTCGREEIIPVMFRQMIEGLRERFPGNVDLLDHYLRRHVELDGDSHGPMASRMLQLLCGDDAERWSLALDAAEQSLQARIALWDAIASDETLAA